MDRSELLLVSTTVRRAIEQWIVNSAHIDPVTLEGACAIASYALHKMLRSLSEESQIVIWDSYEVMCHCWVETNGLIVDLTATQFGDYPDVLISNKRDYDVVVPTLKSKTIRGTSRSRKILNHLDGWKLAQHPSTYKKQIDRLCKKRL